MILLSLIVGICYDFIFSIHTLVSKNYSFDILHFSFLSILVSITFIFIITIHHTNIIRYKVTSPIFLEQKSCWIYIFSKITTAEEVFLLNRKFYNGACFRKAVSFLFLCNIIVYVVLQCKTVYFMLKHGNCFRTSQQSITCM